MLAVKAIASLLGLAATWGLAACAPSSDAELDALALQGEEIYQNVCIACHNGDPNKDGAIGPANAGSSEDLLRGVLLRGEVPPGYTPKRPGSNAMPRFPELEGDIPALAAYLQAVERTEP